MKLFYFILSFITFNAGADSLDIEFKKFFNTAVPTVVENSVLTLAPRDSDVIPVTEVDATISVHIGVSGLSRLLILHGENKYPDKVCRSINKQTYIAGYMFNPDSNISHVLTRFRVDCSSSVVVWAQLIDGTFYKVKKRIQTFPFREN